MTEVLGRLDPTDCALLSLVGKPWMAVVVANNLPRAGKRGAVKMTCTYKQSTGIIGGMTRRVHVPVC